MTAPSIIEALERAEQQGKGLDLDAYEVGQLVRYVAELRKEVSECCWPGCEE